MKILHFHFGKDGGAEQFFVNLVRAMGRRGVEQRLVIRPGRRWRPDVAEAAEIFAESHFRNTSLDRFWLPMRLRRMIRHWKPDAIMAWMSRAGHLLPADADCLRCARLGDYPDRLTQFDNADVLICNAPGIVERVRDLGWTRGVRVITNFTRTERVAAAARKTLDTPPSAPLITSVGRLVNRKGFDVLIRAMPLVPEAYLWIVGDGPEKDNLQTLAAQLGVTDRVRFAGWHHDPRPFIAASDISAMASSHEALGNVILEGWAQRKPVVATRAEGPSWLVEDASNGLLADIGDHEGLAAAFHRLLDNDRLAHKLVAGGEAALRGRFSEDAVVDRYLEAFGSGSSRQAA